MEPKIQQGKTNRPKNLAERLLVRDVADICGCSTRLVRYVLNGERATNTELKEKIDIAAALIQSKRSRMLHEVKQSIHQ